MTIFGVGPRIAVGGIVPLLVVFLGRSGLENMVWPSFLDFIRIPAALLLGCVGLFFWAGSIRLILTGFPRGRLITTGVYGMVRNPMYSAFIVFLVPGLSLMVNRPFLLLSSLGMLFVFKISIKKEEEYLAEKFGKEFQDYSEKVKQIIPFLW